MVFLMASANSELQSACEQLESQSDQVLPPAISATILAEGQFLEHPQV